MINYTPKSGQLVQDALTHPPTDTVFDERRGDKHISDPQPESPFRVPTPGNVKTDYKIDADYNYTVEEKVGDHTYYRAPSSISFE